MPSMASLTGCIPIICTPFTEEGALDRPALAREIEWVLAEGAAGVACVALASEGYKLTEGERDQVIGDVVRAVAGRVPVVASADGPGVEPALDRARRAAALGADALMVLPPSFVRPDAAGLLSYYQRIGQATPLPLIVQDAPQLTGVAMSPALWARMAEQIPTVRAIKVEGTPQGSTITETRELTGDHLGIFCGWGGLGILDALERGAVGSMPAPNFTALFVQIQRSYEGGEVAVAAALFGAELPFLLWAMQSLDHSVAAAKEHLRRVGVFTTNTQRQPAAPLDAIARAQLARFLDERLGSPASESNGAVPPGD
jgi:2-keto-3-deoxy-L-arabinonate dehydratase